MHLNWLNWLISRVSGFCFCKLIDKPDSFDALEPVIGAVARFAACGLVQIVEEETAFGILADGYAVDDWLFECGDMRVFLSGNPLEINPYLTVSVHVDLPSLAVIEVPDFFRRFITTCVDSSEISRLRLPVPVA